VPGAINLDEIEPELAEVTSVFAALSIIGVFVFRSHHRSIRKPVEPGDSDTLKRKKKK
jgi:hypothetical protein